MIMKKKVLLVNFKEKAGWTEKDILNENRKYNATAILDIEKAKQALDADKFYSVVFFLSYSGDPGFINYVAERHPETKLIVTATSTAFDKYGGLTAGLNGRKLEFPYEIKELFEALKN